MRVTSNIQKKQEGNMEDIRRNTIIELVKAGGRDGLVPKFEAATARAYCRKFGPTASELAAGAKRVSFWSDCHAVALEGHIVATEIQLTRLPKWEVTKLEGDALKEALKDRVPTPKYLAPEHASPAQTAAWERLRARLSIIG